jgi:large subunit ribosomal protein L23
MILKRPLITEKTMDLAARGWYTFIVDLNARKNEIADAIALQYKVKVIDVRSMRIHGKMRRVGRKMKYVKKPDTKKAIVRLTEGQKIDAFEVTEQKPQVKEGK